MKKISLHFKVLFIIIGMWLVGSCILVFSSYYHTKTIFFNSAKTRLQNYAVLGAKNISPADHVLLHTRADEKTETFTQLVKTLQYIKKNSTDVLYVYTVRKTPEGKVIFIVQDNWTPDNNEFGYIGEEYAEASDLLRSVFDKPSGVVVEKDFYTDKFGTSLSSYVPIFNANKQLECVFCIDISYNNTWNFLLGHIWMLFFIFLLGLLIIIPIAVLFSRRLTKPIQQTRSMLMAISAGEGDLTKRLTVQTHDESADLAHYFNITLDKLNNLISQIKAQSGHLLYVGQDLSANMDETASSIQQIHNNIIAMQNHASGQQKNIQESADAMQLITQNIQTVYSHIDQQSKSVSQSSSAIEQMLANIASVTTGLNQNTANLNDLRSASEKGRLDLAGVSQKIHDMAKRAQSLLEISGVIETIARQTSLLSMNAAIEAAHAGHVGRGFSVVSDEIRKLAESSTEQTKNVSSLLKAMNTEMDKIRLATATVFRQFEDMDKKIKLVSDREDNIRNAMQEQQVGSKEIFDAISDMNNLTSSVKTLAHEMLENSQKVIEESSNLQSISTDLTGRITQITSGTEQISAAVSSVHTLTQKNKDTINLLVREVEKFKTE